MTDKKIINQIHDRWLINENYMYNLPPSMSYFKVSIPRLKGPLLNSISILVAKRY
ncbi:MAG: hypothetical protein ACTSVV_00200 [Promethearchaeota archaeon]